MTVECHTLALLFSSKIQWSYVPCFSFPHFVVGYFVPLRIRTLTILINIDIKSTCLDKGIHKFSGGGWRRRGRELPCAERTWASRLRYTSIHVVRRSQTFRWCDSSTMTRWPIIDSCLIHDAFMIVWVSCSKIQWLMIKCAWSEITVRWSDTIVALIVYTMMTNIRYDLALHKIQENTQGRTWWGPGTCEHNRCNFEQTRERGEILGSAYRQHCEKLLVISTYLG